MLSKLFEQLGPVLLLCVFQANQLALTYSLSKIAFLLCLTPDNFSRQWGWSKAVQVSLGLIKQCGTSNHKNDNDDDNDNDDNSSLSSKRELSTNYWRDCKF